MIVVPVRYHDQPDRLGVYLQRFHRFQEVFPFVWTATINQDSPFALDKIAPRDPQIDRMDVDTHRGMGGHRFSSVPTSSGPGAGL